MFILTNINIKNDVCQIYDTKDGALYTLRLSMILYHIRKGKVTVRGIGTIGSNSLPKDATPIMDSGFYFSPSESKSALYKFYTSRGVPAAEAKRRSGL